MGSNVELRSGSERRADSVVWRLDKSVGFEGADCRGSKGDSGGVRIGVSETRFPQTHLSRSTSCLGSGTNPHLISPCPSRDMCVTEPRTFDGVTPCVVVPRIKNGLVAGSGQTFSHNSS